MRWRRRRMKMRMRRKRSREKGRKEQKSRTRSDKEYNVSKKVETRWKKEERIENTLKSPSNEEIYM